MGANGTLLITVRLEASLHEPMYYLLSLLSLLDVVLCLTVIPKVLAIFSLTSGQSTSFSACFLQMFIMNSFLPMESCTFMVRTGMWPSATHYDTHPSSLTTLLPWLGMRCCSHQSPLSLPSSITVEKCH